MATRQKARTAPELDRDALTDTFREQLATGDVSDAIAANMALPPLLSPRGQSARVERCVWRNVTLSDTRAPGLRMRDALVESCDLANADLAGGLLDRVEFHSTRLTGATCTEAQFKSVLFRECKLDFLGLRMAKLSQCVFEKCNLTDADFYDADLSGNTFRGCDLSRADLSHAKLKDADIRDCRLDGIRGMPANTEGLIISPDQAPLLITLFGVRVAG
jgi:uncharacterized protein YjbI with pentapeptide repeats